MDQEQGQCFYELLQQTKNSMNHKFPKTDIPEGQRFVEIQCINCGLASRTYRSGARAYYKENGSTTPYPPPCKSEFEYSDQPKEPIVLQTVAETIVIKPVVRTHPTLAKIDEAGARLKDAMILINLMYEDLVKHDVYSNSRRMAGRFLYSQGYEEIVKSVEHKIA